MKRFIFISLFITALCMFAPVVHAASITLSPTSGNYAVNDTISVTITVNTDNQDTTSADAVINYDPTLLGTPSVTDGTLYSVVQTSQQTNSLLVSGFVENAGDVVNSTGTLATLQFTALTSGIAAVTVSCTSGSTTDSNVSKNDVDSTDILDCGQIVNASYTIGSSTTPTATATIASIPQAGFFDVAQITPLLIVGMLLIGAGLLPLLL